MGVILLLLAGVMGLIFAVCTVVVCEDAFRSGIGRGVLCVCVPFYAAYHLVAKLAHPNRTVIVTAYFASAALAGGLVVAGVY